jgi:hypothetical protein
MQAYAKIPLENTSNESMQKRSKKEEDKLESMVLLKSNKPKMSGQGK